MAQQTENVKIGPATVEFGDVEGGTGVTFDITQGGIVFSTTTEVHDTTVDQYGNTPVKSTMIGRTAQVTVPFALYDLDKLASATPNSKLVTDATDQTKKKLEVKAESGYDMLAAAKKLVIKPLDANATANEWITIPVASPRADIEYTFNSENERVANITFVAYPDDAGVLFIFGDETAAEA